MSIAKLPIDLDHERIAEFCRQRGIRKLSLFGSVLRDDFNPATSDVDVLAEFFPDVRPGLKFFGYGDELAEILGRKSISIPRPGSANTSATKSSETPSPSMSKHDPR